MIGVLASYHRALIEAPEPSLRGRIMDHLIHCAPAKLSSRHLAAAMGIRGKKGMTRLRVALQRLATEGYVRRENTLSKDSPPRWLYWVPR